MFQEATHTKADNDEDISNTTEKTAVSKWKILLFENLFLQDLAGSTKDNKVDVEKKVTNYC